MRIVGGVMASGWTKNVDIVLASGRMLKSRSSHPPNPGAPRRAFSHAAFSHRSETQRTEAYASPLRSLRPC